ncbi:MAG: hypothetical protein ACHQXA_04040 [Gemmatimonadales bacterium]
MRNFWIFCHLAGFTMWLGGGLGAMFVSLANKQAPRDQLATVARSLAAVYRKIIGPGAALVVISGLILTMQLMAALGAGGGAPISPWLLWMQGAGLIGAALVLVILLPAASRLARLDPVAQAPAFDAVRTRLRLFGAITGILGIVALVSGAMLR